MKFLLGLLAMVTIINMTGKGNLAPTSAMEQIMNYVLGGIIGGVIYSRDVRIWQFAIVLIIWFVLVYGMVASSRGATSCSTCLMVPLPW